ncbi:C2 calcium-dependent membrane targeting [Artemisia annua]|uniref:C2 calcium-dependent membrane targeting n=1 Tax=Artemisia annua TaxID=35608 RepID=A0A2U1MJG2_ARTAN|nr:C2 calcium-dependent membrane targeting [Artemisia annua]
MDSSYDQTSRFRYNPTTEGSTQFSGILEIYIHHARNIHNICIYENQDVYAKFSLTYNPDETFSTRIINGGGKNPEFNEKLVIKINQYDAVLKCEMWMLSRAKSFMEDQLLGFVLVPISLVSGKGELTQDFSLSSTDLFHSPAGTVKLSLSLDTNSSFNHNVDSVTSSSITSEVVLLDTIEYSRIEFPDINVVRENQQMVSEYFGLSGHGALTKPAPIGHGSFLCLGASGSDHRVDDYEMVANSGSISPNDSIQNSGFFSSTMTSLSDDRNSADSLEKKNTLVGESTNSTSVESSGSKDNNLRENKEVKEESEMQQQIVDMYMRSMQQFTESLAKMKLPMNLEKVDTEDRGDVFEQPKNNVEIETKKKDGGRVFYGSRAFF